MAGPRGLDVLIVSLGSTAGLRAADEELAASLERAGASVELAPARRPREVRTMMLTDLAWARAARRAASEALRARATAPSALIYSTTTASLLWPACGAIRFDAPASANRPGRHGVWQRRLERRRLREAGLLLPSSEGALRELAPPAADASRALVVPVPVEPSAAVPAPAPARDIAAVTYGANPAKKGIDRVLSAWRALRGQGALGACDELLVAGASADDLRRAGIALARRDAVRALGPLAPGDYRALLRRARVFVCAARREDYGITQLEALADGCLLVTTPSPGPYVALALARALDERLVGDDLARSLRAALHAPLPGYAERARSLLARFRRDAVDALVAEQLVPRLLGRGRLGEPRALGELA